MSSATLISLFGYKAWANSELKRCTPVPPRDLYTLFLHQNEPARKTG